MGAQGFWIWMLITMLYTIIKNWKLTCSVTEEWFNYGEGNGNPLQCSCLENLRDGGAWWAAIYGVAQSRTRLKQLSSSSSHDTSDLITIEFYISASKITLLFCHSWVKEHNRCSGQKFKPHLMAIIIIYFFLSPCLDIFKILTYF